MNRLLGLPSKYRLHRFCNIIPWQYPGAELRRLLFKESIFFFLFITPLLASCSGNKNGHMKGSYPSPDKCCALTFDDGPSADPELTTLVLDTLIKHNAHATFFLVGQNINEETKNIVKRIVKEGHEIGNHSWSYENMSAMSEEQVKSNFDKTNEQIKKYASCKPKFFRAPYLSASKTMYRAIDLPFIGGSVNYDWKGGGSDSVEKVVASVKSSAKDGAIILLHDVQPKPHPTPEALAFIVDELRKEGYELVTLSELFRRKKVKPDASLGMMYVSVE